MVVDHDKRRVVWAGKGRSAETLEKFFDLLGPSGCEQIVLVTADLAASWQKALRAKVPHAEVVFDRFHVERLASDAVDEVGGRSNGTWAPRRPDAQGVALLPAETPRRGSSPGRSDAWRRYAARIVPSIAPTS